MCIVFLCGVYILVSSTKALLRLIKTTHVAFHHPLLRSHRQKRWVLPCSILTVFFCNSVTRWSSPGTRAWLQSIAPRLRSGQRGHCFPWKSFMGFCIHAGISALWKTTPTLYTTYRYGMSPITESICPKSSHTHKHTYMHEQLRVDGHFNKNL